MNFFKKTPKTPKLPKNKGWVASKKPPTRFKTYVGVAPEFPSRQNFAFRLDSKSNQSPEAAFERLVNDAHELLDFATTKGVDLNEEFFITMEYPSPYLLNEEYTVTLLFPLADLVSAAEAATRSYQSLMVDKLKHEAR